MLKVLIADDEKKVCQLIVNLVDWESFGFEISSVVSDGISAYKFLQEHAINVLITDIRMPGYDGLELIQKAKVLYPDLHVIIISGYSQFDYAQNAIRYGVEEYLLKPIRKKDLTATLLKIGDKYQEEVGHAKNWESMQKRLVENEAQVKKSFLEDLLKHPEKFGGFFLREKINEKYHYNFSDACYQSVIIKLIPGEKREHVEMTRVLLQKGQQIVNEALEGMCNEVVVAALEGEIFGIFNGTKEELEAVYRKLKKIKFDIQRLKDVFREIQVYIALGKEIDNLQKITESFETARNAMRSRFYSENQFLLKEYEHIDFGKEVKVMIDNSFKKRFLSHIEILDLKSIEDELEVVSEKLLSLDVEDGNVVYESYKEILTLFYFGVHHYEISIPDQYTELIAKLELFGSIKETFEFLKTYISNSLMHWIEEKKYVESRPIRSAKRYISEHYYTAITLEVVSKEIGFNPNYFSGMFKKETNMNFSDYLKNVRIDNAKSILLNTDQTVEDVSYAVGYSDTKHFSRLFKQLTGVTPTEYRKLYN